MRSPISAVTIVKSRTEKLANLITQLEQCSPTPDELVIVWMAPPSDLSLVRSDKFNIVHKFVTQDSESAQQGYVSGQAREFSLPKRRRSYCPIAF